MKPQEILEGKSSQWIFGYGSLVWKPDFVYQRRQIGYVEGYKRRFWHGDDFYRGDKKNPGRVVTLIEDQEACTWGVAYEVTDAEINEAFQYLNVREVVLGGYITKTVEFIPQEKGRVSRLEFSSRTKPTICRTSTPLSLRRKNQLWENNLNPTHYDLQRQRRSRG
ncbi:glutathione-specific gamma-glutamylcyclotransferase 1-like isoform X2 [Nerophis ophidion]|uniref:glutathione-specific gamma-glutamylcyclotransferase 1-like isoform X2 n=1 Tax=Nerophis ophidion TaxID=159077 RepID=UPI002ADFA5D8|nr:glutathione-specific gamma-glutamylcyclotransferase 1-like isoform X2 [Nerophis ophidion]